MSKIAIIGTGKLGTRLSEQLIQEKVPEEIFLWNRSKGRLEGTIQSLKIWGKLINSSVKISKFDLSNVSRMDIIVIVIKDDYDPRLLLVEKSYPKWLPNNLRFVGLHRDLPQIKNLCSELYHYSGIVIIITNPVDVITTFVTKWLPNSQVYGFGLSVDSARLNYLLSTSYNKNFSNIGLVLGGEHGGKLVPMRSLWHGDKSIAGLDEKAIKKLLNKSNKLSINIVKNLGYTLQDCAYVFCNDISWILGKLDRMISMFSIWNEIACIGYPVFFQTNSQRITKYEKITQEEKDNIVSCEKDVFHIVNLISERFDFKY